jgi:hypothetical protein
MIWVLNDLETKIRWLIEINTGHSIANLVDSILAVFFPSNLGGIVQPFVKDPFSNSLGMFNIFLDTCPICPNLVRFLIFACVKISSLFETFLPKKNQSEEK